MVGVEEDVVVDPVPLDEVLVPGGAVADRAEAGGLGDGRVGPLRESLERVGDQVLGERLLLGADTGRARQVDGERGGVRHGDRRGGGIAVVVLAGRDAVRSRRSVGAVVVAGRALVGTGRVVGGLAGAVALEGGERSARVAVRSTRGPSGCRRRR